MRRRLDWPECLYAYIEAHRGTPFAWGEHDCALFVAGAVQAMTGMDPLAAIRGTYSDTAGAWRAMLALGPGLEGALTEIASRNGWERVPAALARRGDVVLCDRGDENWPRTVAVCMGAEAITTAPEGFTAIPMTAAVAAWRV